MTMISTAAASRDPNARGRGIRDTSAFHAYDIRGRVGENLDAAFAHALGRAYAEQFAPRRVAIGGDARLSSPELVDALSDGLQSAGVEVWDLGLTGTEQIYHAAFALDVDGGIQVTASHNPQEYNGMKLVTREARPIGSGTGLKTLEQSMRRGSGHGFGNAGAGQHIAGRAARGRRIRADAMARYIDTLLDGFHPESFPDKRVLLDAGNGAAGPVLVALAERLGACRSPLELVLLRETPDGRFPDGVPNPMLAAMRARTAHEQRICGADLAVAFDGDFDRCFLFDEDSEFVNGYYLVGYLAKLALARAPGSHIVHDPRQHWHTVECIADAGGRAVVERTGHVFQKARMRAENAVYGGEISGHHYFRSFGFCDSGMLPWLQVVEALGNSSGTTAASRAAGAESESLAVWMRGARRRFPASEETNFCIADGPAAIADIGRRFGREALRVDTYDGLNVEYADWRFNLRGSNTEPLLRLNVETRGDPDRLAERLATLGAAIEALGGQPE